MKQFKYMKSLFFLGKAGGLSGLLLLVAITGCSKKEDPKGIDVASPQLEAPQDQRNSLNEGLLITDEQGKPLKAQILIGDRLGAPFVNNFISTDSAGKAPLPEGWTGPQSVTIDSPGYIRLTLLEQNPQALRVQLKKIPEARIEMRGTSQGFPVKDYDRNVDFGLLLTSLRKSDVFTFTPDMVISPVTDKLSVAGQSFELPSNVTLPRQKETYILPITLEKPQYRMFYTNQGKQNVFMARGQFPLREVVDGFQNKKEVFELINLFAIQGGQIREVNLNSPLVNENFAVNELSFNEKFNFKAPTFGSEQVLLVVSAAERKDSYLPSDVKRFNSGETLSLNIFPQQRNVLLGIMKNRAEFKSDSEGIDRFSAHLLQSTNSSMRFMPMIENPEVVNNQTFLFRAPQTPSGIKALGMSVLISTRSSTLQRFASFDGRGQIPRWEIRSLTWSERLALPQWPESISQIDVFAPSQKIQVSFVATNRSVDAQTWEDVLDSATHVSHASKNY